MRAQLSLICNRLRGSKSSGHEQKSFDRQRRSLHVLGPIWAALAMFGRGELPARDGSAEAVRFHERPLGRTRPLRFVWIGCVHHGGNSQSSSLCLVQLRRGWMCSESNELDCEMMRHDRVHIGAPHWQSRSGVGRSRKEFAGGAAMRGTPASGSARPSTTFTRRVTMARMFL